MDEAMKVGCWGLSENPIKYTERRNVAIVKSDFKAVQCGHQGIFSSLIADRLKQTEKDTENDSYTTGI